MRQMILQIYRTAHVQSSCATNLLSVSILSAIAKQTPSSRSLQPDTALDNPIHVTDGHGEADLACYV